MNRLLTVGCVGLVFAWASMSGLAEESGAVTSRTALAVGQEASSSVLDGVFTSAQALRGGGLYNEHCTSCHGPDFLGDEMAPSIAGNDFLVFWTEVPVGMLFDRIRTTMPADAPGQLSDEEYTDVLAYLREASSYPSGEAELPADKAALAQIMIVAPAE